VEVTEFYLTGYSLGGFQSAFVAKLDEQEMAFDFRKVLMINPPLSLFNSVSRLDKMLDDIPGGIDNFDAYFQEMVEGIARYYRKDVFVAFDEDLFYNIFKEMRREGVPPPVEQLPPLVGFAFRISSGNMIFCSDIMTRANLIVPRDLRLSPLDSLNQFAPVVFRTPFLAYFDELFLPYHQRRQAGLTRQRAIDALSLKAIEGYLAGATKVGLVHNADDVIMEPGEVDELARIFGSRAQIYPKGGHCGNMEYPDNVAYMTRFFAQ
jgi:pimeloyl-ACP methyl ester carboxylesterase